MSIELTSLLVLIAIFVIPAIAPLNMGLVGLVAAYAFGTLAIGLSGKEVTALLPSDLFLTLVGVTFLFSVAQQNGTVHWLATIISRLSSPRTVPIAVFGATCSLTAFGGLAPAAVALLLPVAMTYARTVGLSPFLLGLLVIHGSQAGGFSPLGVYGGIAHGALSEAGLPWKPLVPFAASFLANAGAAIAAWHFYARRRAGSSGPASPIAVTTDSLKDRRQAFVTLGGLLAFAVLTLAFQLDIGPAAIGVGLALTLAGPSNRTVVQAMPWTEILLITGIATYVAVLQKAGVIASVGELVAAVGNRGLAVFLLFAIAAVVSAFASSTAVLGSLIPLAVPLLVGEPEAAPFIIAGICVAATIVDVSPFSTAGALVISNAAEGDRQSVTRDLMVYGGIVTFLTPPALWVCYQLL